MEKFYLGLDIGGTKCAAVVGTPSENGFRVVEKRKIETLSKLGAEQTVERLFAAAEDAVRSAGVKPEAIGISCGGPLSSKTGRVFSPPNLPGWDDVPICALAQARFGAPAYLQNDANACALAEWKFGAGKGCQNMIFLTFGTGMGAGLILDGRLYDGATGMAGEVGHIRLAAQGPLGYDKHGSFEGFCSGGGLAAAAKDAGLSMNAKELSEAARRGDVRAKEIITTSARQLGKALAILVDVLNPERIVIGSIFARCEDLFREEMTAALQEEALGACLAGLEIVPAGLGEEIGDWASLCVAAFAEQNTEA